MKRFILPVVVLAALILGCKGPQKAVEVDFVTALGIPECVITTPPDSLHLDPWYKKYVDVNGIPLCSSWRCPDSALVAGHNTLWAMTSMLSPEIMDALRSAGTRVTMMGRYEGTTDVPEHRWLVNDTTLNWDLRARGLGGDLELPLTSCAEENVLGYQIDKYHAEDILIHEFAHSIHLIGILQVEPDINDRLQALLDNAIEKDLWWNLVEHLPHQRHSRVLCRRRAGLVQRECRNGPPGRQAQLREHPRGTEGARSRPV